MDELTRELDKTKAPNDGGPAFPLAPVADPDTGQFIGPHSTGMSLLDWFAGVAPENEVDSIIPFRKWARDEADEAGEFIGMPAGEFKWVNHYHLVVAKARYIWAAAMIAAREAK